MNFDSRHLARERALNLLYEAEIKGITHQELISTLPLSPDKNVVEILEGIEKEKDLMDELLSRFAKEWPLKRMPAVDRAIMRVAIYELKNTDTPTAVILNEAVELCKEYSTQDSGKFVNGVLAGLKEELRQDTHNSSSEGI